MALSVMLPPLSRCLLRHLVLGMYAATSARAVTWQ
jgi:hypothetical protein